MLRRDGGSPFTDRLKFITLELPKYHDPADPEATALDKLCFALHNMTTFRNRPEYLQGKFFELLFEKAEIANEVIKYEKDMLTQWDIDEYVGEQVEKGVKEGHERGLREGMAKGMKEGRAEGREKGRKEGREEGRKEGREEGRTEILKLLIASGMPIDEVAQRSGLTIDEVVKLTGSSH